MRIVKSLLPVLVLASLFSSLSYAATPDRISGALTSGQTVPLKGNVHQLARPEFDQGPVDPAMRLGTITLATLPTAAQQKAINLLLAQQQNPKSSNYHKWLTPEQYADRFGLSRNDMQQMTAWLKSKGFTMIQQAHGRNWISFTGTAAQVQNAFGTEIHHFNVNGELHYANATAPQIPAALSGVVTGFRGLDDFRPRPHGIRRNNGVRPYYNSSNFGDLVAPGDIATIYDINALYTAGIDGTGQKLAVMGRTDIYLSDITDFRTGFGMSAISCTTSSDVITACSDPHFSYVLDGTDPGLSPSGDISEADLDLEWSGAVAPGAQLIYVNSTDTFTSYYYSIDQNLAPVISLSYGFCEFYDNILAADEAELQKGNLEGITIVNSSGDAGAAECEYSATLTAQNLATQGIAVSYPASSPEVTGAGGTAIPLANFTSTYWGTTNGTDGGTALSYIPEQAWNDDNEIAQFCQGQSVGSSGYTFCQQGGTPPQAGWVPITNAQTAQEDIGISSTGGGASNCSVQNSSFTSCVSGFPQPSWQTVTITGQSTRLSPDVSFLATPNFPGYIFCTQLSELSGDTGTGSSCAPGGTAGITNALNLNTPSLIGGTSASAPVFAGIVTLLNQYLAGSSSSGLGNVNPTLYSLAQTPSNGAFNPVTTGDNTVACVAGTPSTQPVALQCPGTGVLGFQGSTSDPTTGYNMVTGLGSVDVNNLAIAWAASRSSSSVSLTPSATQVYQTTSVTLTATVTPSSATGNVTFNNGSTVLGTVALSGGTGIATFTTTSLPVGTNTITATYNGSGSVSNSTSTAATVTVSSAFTLAPTATSFSVTQGATINPTVTVTLNGGFTGTLTFTCTDPAPESICTPPPNTNTSGTVSFQITTTAPTADLRRPFDRGTRIFYALLLPGLLGIVFTAGSRRRSLRGMRFLGLIVVLGFSTLWLASCGGSSNSNPGNQGTVKGSYTITVNATSGNITGTPVTFTMVVQ
jgi:subtilase family serine protease